MTTSIRCSQPGHRTSSRLLALIVAIALVGAALTGCGGGGGSTPPATTGRVTLSITWPARTKLIPLAADSITVSFLNENGVVASQTVPRPISGNSTAVTSRDLTAGAYTIKSQAFPTSDGSGTAQASASQIVTVVAGSTVEVAITMASTIQTIDLSQSAPATIIGATTSLTATPKNAAGATVITLPDTISWKSSNTAVATVDTNGNVTGVAVGTATITVTETESNKSAFVTVTVTTNVTTGGVHVTVN